MMKEFKEAEDIFNTKEFKSLSFWKRLRLRLWIAFLHTITMF
jgi:hypothetical protein